MKTLPNFLLLIGLALTTACSQDIDPFEQVQQVHYFIPEVSSTLQVSGFPQPERNVLSEEGVLLGKKLFFDPKLSSNGKVSCATCHMPQLAFTDGESLGKLGVSGQALLRTSPTLVNLAWQLDGLFWDGGANDLESLNFAPLTHPDEMGANLEELVQYLLSSVEYRQHFELVFESELIQSAHISRAISQYVRTLISQDSKYDQWQMGKASLSDLELKGYQVYKNNCSSCHREGLFTDRYFHNNGLDKEYPNPPELEGLYQGRFRITSNPKDMGAYKTPTLRNIELTAPYMHDGRFKTLEEVLDHYQNGIQINESLAPQLIRGIVLSPEEKSSLLAFLSSLTDSVFIQKHLQLSN